MKQDHTVLLCKLAPDHDSNLFSLSVQVALQLLGLDKPSLDAWALVCIDLAHFISDFGAVVETPCLFVPIPLKRLLAGSRVT